MIPARNELDRVGDHIRRFDESGVLVCSLSTVGRSASNLVHSILDGHPQVLAIPTMFWYYLDMEDWAYKEEAFSAQWIKDFILGSSLSIRWYDSFLQDNYEAYYKIVNELMERAGQKNRKSFFLSLHYAYALLAGIDIRSVKVILNHHHFHVSNSSKWVLKRAQNLFLPLGSPEFGGSIREEALSDFPEMKVMCTVRNYFDLMYSTYKSTLVSNTIPIRSRYFLLNMIGNVIGAKELLSIKERLRERFLLLEFEKIHSDIRDTMETIISFLGVGYHPSMAVSTFRGKPWMGNNPHRPLMGADPTAVTMKWRDELSSEFLQLVEKAFLGAPAYNLNDLISVNATFHPSLITKEEKSLLTIDQRMVFSAVPWSTKLAYLKFRLKYRENRRAMLI